MKNIFSPHAPGAVGPYSHAMRSGNMVYCSGQTPLDTATMQIEARGIEAQTACALQNLEAVLAAAGLTLQDVIKVNVYLTDMANFSAMNMVYAEIFGGHLPARTTVAVRGLPYDALVEIDCVAESDKD